MSKAFLRIIHLSVFLFVLLKIFYFYKYVDSHRTMSFMFIIPYQNSTSLYLSIAISQIFIPLSPSFHHNGLEKGCLLIHMHQGFTYFNYIPLT